MVPRLTLTENASSSTADVGGAPVTFTVVLGHHASSTADAFDVSLSDLVPAGFTVVAGSFQNTAGVVPTSINQSGNSLSATFSTLGLGQSSTFTFQAVLNGTSDPGQTLTNTPAVVYTTLPGSVTTPQTENSAVSTERTGVASDPGGPVNDLTVNDSASVTASADSISGFVYVDANNDGVKQNGEAAVSGVTVTLTGTDLLSRPVFVSTVTLGDGSYSFTGLAPGTYTVAETQPQAYLDGMDSVGIPGGTNPSKNTFSVTLIPIRANIDAVGYNFGELVPASLSGFVYVDANNDGVKQGGESGIDGVTVTLTGVDDLENPVSLSMPTAEGGFYSFGNLRPGTYVITETQPPAYLEGKDTLGTQGGSKTVKNMFSNVVVASGTTGTGNNFGELVPSSLGGFVYVDANNDGVKQNGETGIDGVTVTLTGVDDLENPVNLSTPTVEGGFYSFGNLRPGTYVITETQPGAYLDGKNTLGTQGGATAVKNAFSAVPVVSGTDGTANNFGELVPASLAGFVYVDANNDGIKQPAESGLSGVTVTLTGVDDLENSVNIAVATASDGSYSFTNLRPGTYTITETQPEEYYDGKDTVGTPGGSTEIKNAFTNVTVISGTAGTDNNFGELGPASLAGRVYVDSNNDGVRQPTEMGLPGVVVTLTGVDDHGQPVSASTMTTGDGSYIFLNLRPGTYAVHETQPMGITTARTPSALRGSTEIKNAFTNVTVISGTAGTDNNFGEPARRAWPGGSTSTRTTTA
ncbi:MAG: SdrD B-like domain-containing protein [Isosphaeraceae bacterium]